LVLNDSRGYYKRARKICSAQQIQHQSGGRCPARTHEPWSGYTRVKWAVTQISRDAVSYPVDRQVIRNSPRSRLRGSNANRCCLEWVDQPKTNQTSCIQWSRSITQERLHNHRKAQSQYRQAQCSFSLHVDIELGGCVRWLVAGHRVGFSAIASPSKQAGMGLD